MADLYRAEYSMGEILTPHPAEPRSSAAEYSARPGASPGTRPATVCGLLGDGALRSDSPSATLACQADDEHPGAAIPPPRARARFLSSPSCRAAGAAAHRFHLPYRAETAKRVRLTIRNLFSFCFPHNLNRRASACGPGRIPAPQPPPPPGGCEGAAVPEGAGSRSTAGYPQPFQTPDRVAPRLATVLPQVFHRAGARLARPRSRRSGCPPANRRPGSARDPFLNPPLFHRLDGS